MLILCSFNFHLKIAESSVRPTVAGALVAGCPGLNNWILAFNFNKLDPIRLNLDIKDLGTKMQDCIVKIYQITFFSAPLTPFHLRQCLKDL